MVPSYSYGTTCQEQVWLCGWYHHETRSIRLESFSVGKMQQDGLLLDPHFCSSWHSQQHYVCGDYTRGVGRAQEWNAPHIFQLSSGIATHVQGPSSVASYYTRLKVLWDELSSYNVIPSCTCGSSKELLNIYQREKVMQFLIGLNERFNSIRSQILLMDPLPTVTRAYSLLLQEERH